MSVTSLNQILPLLKQGVELELNYLTGGSDFITVETVEEKYITSYSLVYSGARHDGEDFDEVYSEVGLADEFKNISVL